MCRTRSWHQSDGCAMLGCCSVPQCANGGTCPMDRLAGSGTSNAAASDEGAWCGHAARRLLALNPRGRRVEHTQRLNRRHAAGGKLERAGGPGDGLADVPGARSCKDGGGERAGAAQRYVLPGAACTHMDQSLLGRLHSLWGPASGLTPTSLASGRAATLFPGPPPCAPPSRIRTRIRPSNKSGAGLGSPRRGGPVGAKLRQRAGSGVGERASFHDVQ